MRPSAHFIHLLSLFSLLSLSHADSVLFSQFVGATAIPATYVGTLSEAMSICTNYIHQIPNPSGLPATAFSQIFQEDVDGVCKFCSSLAQTRIDSCCGQASSSACFAGFGGDAVPATASASTTASTSAGGSTIISFPTSVADSASSTTTSATATRTAAAATSSAITTTSASNANQHAAVHLVQPIAIALLGLLI
ncbi:hypothetical protein UA08_05584 [Talaromyces atroroseus]|uniref:Fungal calcium binding protein domain-containing protein n=1 Tax=Talaromyces atroroseus TaxID=1441469 RepID=A0A225AKD7_TALAT|nr:hypothetical protein UA08_05584 [Talaromyces atroroseus]OKL58764.1 hypothetical protein UA08_05584 [Talaromyces atroroseus]